MPLVVGAREVLSEDVGDVVLRGHLGDLQVPLDLALAHGRLLDLARDLVLVVAAVRAEHVPPLRRAAALDLVLVLLDGGASSAPSLLGALLSDAASHQRSMAGDAAGILYVARRWRYL